MASRLGGRTNSSGSAPSGSGPTDSRNPSPDPVEVAIADAVNQGLRFGDVLSFTSGRECYPMGNGGFVEVGPISVTLLVREGERPEQAYQRARALVEVLMQAEFALKKNSYAGRLKELHA